MKEKKYPEAIVGAFIKNRKGELLFVKSPKWKGLWTIPGGHVELGERTVDALRREVMEEVGLKVKVARLLDIQQAIYPKSFVRKAHFIFFTYLCECQGSEKVRLDKEEVHDYKWIRPEAAKKMRIGEFERHPLKLMLLKGTYEVSIPTELEKKLL